MAITCVLNLDDCYKLECAKLMYDVSQGKVEDYFQKLFQLLNSSYNIQTRPATAGHLSLPLAGPLLRNHHSGGGGAIFKLGPHFLTNNISLY